MIDHEIRYVYLCSYLSSQRKKLVFQKGPKINNDYSIKGERKKCFYNSFVGGNFL